MDAWSAARRLVALLSVLAAGLAIGSCGSRQRADPASLATAATATSTLPGSDRPPITIGDKNFAEQFVLGELYELALRAQGFQVSLNPNIGTTSVTYQALTSGRLDMYPEYVNVWDSFVAGYRHGFPTARAAFAAAGTYASAHGLGLLQPTPFSDTSAVAVTGAYAAAHGLRQLGDLLGVDGPLAFGAPTQFQESSVGLEAIEQAYGFTPTSVVTLDTGTQYQALTKGTVQAAWMTSTDGELAGRTFRMLRDPQHVFGWGQAMPVVPIKVLAAEGPDFAATINRVSRLLTLRSMRQLNAEVELQQQTPAAVAKQFLQQHGLLPPSSP